MNSSVFLLDPHFFNFAVVQVILMLVRVPGAVLVLCSSTLGVFYIRALYFSL